MKDYNNYLFRVSSLDRIMAGFKTYGETLATLNMEKAKIKSKWQAASDTWESFKNKETQTAKNKERIMQNYSDKFLSLVEQTKNIEAKKDDVVLSEGCKTYLLDVLIAESYNRTVKDVRSKYLEKGLMLEEKCITTYSLEKGILYEKSLERKDDGYIMGEIDFEDEITIYDTKASWDLWTFFRNVKYLDVPEQCPYYSNAQGYMRLWKKNKTVIVYVLEDTPAVLIKKEKDKLLRDFVGTSEDYDEACAELERNMKFQDIPRNKRIIEIPIKRDDEFIERIPKVVDACREYLNILKEKFV